LAVILHSPHPASECERRLRLSTKHDSPVIGTIGAGAATLRKRIWYRNSFQTVLALTWDDAGSGADIDCHARLHILAIVFLAVWFGAVSLAGLLFLLVPAEAISGDRADALKHVAIVLLVGVAIVGLSRLLARNEEKYLIDFVGYMLDAERRPT
jgi:hypothetical protein